MYPPIAFKNQDVLAEGVAFGLPSRPLVFVYNHRQTKLFECYTYFTVEKCTTGSASREHDARLYAYTYNLIRGRA